MTPFGESKPALLGYSQLQIPGCSPSPRSSFLITSQVFLTLFKFIYLFIFRETGKEGEREGEKH